MSRQSVLSYLCGCMRNGVSTGQKYRKLAFNRQNLYFVNVITSMMMSGVGDFFCQSITKMMDNEYEYDGHRTAKMVISDGYMSASASHLIYRKIDARWPGRSLATTLKKLALDQCLVAPMSITIFYFAVGYMSAHTLAEILADMRKSLGKVYLAQISIWMPAQIFNFYFVPSKYRMFYVSSFSLLEATFISRIRFDSLMGVRKPTF